MLIIGIDPGINGAIAAIEWDAVPRIREICDMPTRQRASRRTVDAVELTAILNRLRGGDTEVQVTVEASQAFPGMAVSNVFNYGWTNGVIHGALQLWGEPITFVGAAHWKKALSIKPSPGTNAKARKELSMQAAIEVFGERQRAQWFPNKGHDGRAEAALIAYALGVTRSASAAKAARNEATKQEEAESDTQPKDAESD